MNLPTPSQSISPERQLGLRGAQGDAQAILRSIDISQPRRSAWLRAATGILLLIWIGIPLPAGGLFARGAFSAAQQTVSR